MNMISEQEKIIQMYKENISCMKIGKVLGKNENYILRRVKKYINLGLIEKRKSIIEVEINEDKMMELYFKDYTFDMIAQELKCGKTTVINKIEKKIKNGQIKKRIKKEKYDIELIVRMYNEGQSYDDIAKVIHVCHTTVKNIVDKLLEKKIISEREVKHIGPFIEFDEQDINKIIDMYNKNISIEKIADTIRCSTQTILKRINQLLKEGKINKRKPISRNKKINEEIILKMYLEEKKIKDIAKYFNCDKSRIVDTVRKLRNEGKVEYRAKKIKYDDNEIIRIYHERKGSHYWVGAYFNKSKVWATNKLRKLYKEGKLPSYGTYQWSRDYWFPI